MIDPMSIAFHGKNSLTRGRLSSSCCSIMSRAFSSSLRWTLAAPLGKRRGSRLSKIVSTTDATIELIRKLFIGLSYSILYLCSIAQSDCRDQLPLRQRFREERIVLQLWFSFVS